MPKKKEGESRRAFFGRVTGEALPLKAIKVGNVIIQPKTDEWSVKEPPTVKDIKWADDGSHYWYVPKTYITIQSNVYFAVLFPKKSKPPHLDTLWENEIWPLQVALSLLSERNPYQVELLTPRPLKFSVPIQPKPLDGHLLLRFQRAHHLIRKDSVAAKAAAQFGRAIGLAAIATDGDQEEAALLAHFKVIETLAHTPFGTRSVNSTADEERDRVVASLLKTLNSDRSTGKKCSAIYDAQNKLEGIAGKSLRNKIIAFADSVGLGDKWKDQASAFLKLRSKHLGHSGNPTSRQMRMDWLKGTSDHDSAFQLTRAMFAAYLDALDGNR